MFIRKFKINLEDYPYQKDIENRLFLANLSQFDTKVLEEILYHPLTISIEEFANELGVKSDKVISSLKKISPSGLLSFDDTTIIVKKGPRKNYESEIVRFEEDFDPDLNFFQSLLKKVSMHVLPTWYAIPRSSNDIFGSIIEKYLETPKTYLRYVKNLEFDNPVLSHIVDDLFQAPDFKLIARAVKSKYGLSDREFVELTLLLELHFLCSLSYEPDGDSWQEVLTPFHEWHEYLRFRRDTTPSTIKETVICSDEESFAFVKAMNTLRASLPVSLENLSQEQERVAERLQALDLVEASDGELQAVSSPAWESMQVQDQAITLYRHLTGGHQKQSRDVRELEKSLKRVIYSGWINTEVFIREMTAPIGDNEPVCLQKQGRRWEYVLPKYSDEDKALVKEMLTGPLFEAGIIALGTYEEGSCFQVTPFGRITLE